MSEPQRVNPQAQAAIIAEIPSSCTCTWEWSPRSGYRWERIGVKEDCPWHRAGDTLMAKVRQP